MLLWMPKNFELSYHINDDKSISGQTQKYEILVFGHQQDDTKYLRIFICLIQIKMYHKRKGSTINYLLMKFHWTKRSRPYVFFNVIFSDVSPIFCWKPWKFLCILWIQLYLSNPVLHKSLPNWCLQWYENRIWAVDLKCIVWSFHERNDGL